MPSALQAVHSIKSLTKEKTARQTLGLYASQILTIALGLVIVPLITRLLGPDDYGRYSFVLALLSFVALFFEFGFFAAGARILSTTTDKTDERELIGTLLLIGFGISAAFSAVVFALSFVVNPVFHTELRAVLELAAIPAFFMPLQLLMQQVSQGSNQIGRWSIANLIPSLWMLLGLVVLYHFHAATFPRVLLLQLSGVALLAITAAIGFRPLFSVRDKHLSRLKKETAEYGRALYVGRIIDVSTYNLDSLLISFFLNTTSVGYYSLATLMTSPMVLLSDSFATSAYKNFASQERLTRKILWLNTAWLLGSGLALLLLGHFLITLLFSNRYLPVQGLLIPLIVAAFFQGLYKPYNAFFAAKGKGQWLRSMSLVMGAVNLVGNLALIPHWGAYGAGIGSALGTGVYFFACRYFYQRYVAELPKQSATTKDKAYFDKLFAETAAKGTDDPWNHDTRISQQLRYAENLTMLKALGSITPETRLLDIGCSYGSFCAKLQAEFQLADIYGGDISEIAIAQAKKRYPDKAFHFAVNHLPSLQKYATASFDGVFLLEVLYYLPASDQVTALKEVERILKPNGFLFISANLGPNYYTSEQFHALLSPFFTLTQTRFSYNKLGAWIDSQALMLLDTPLAPFGRSTLRQAWLSQLSTLLSRTLLGKYGITEEVIVATKTPHQTETKETHETVTSRTDRKV